MTIAEQIYAIVKTLPQDQASEILTFAEFIRAKHLNANQPSGTVDSRFRLPLSLTMSASFLELRDLQSRTGID
jgi:hypothetical protein